MKVLGNSVSGEGLHAGLYTSLHGLSSGHQWREALRSLSKRTLILSDQHSALMTSFNPNDLLSGSIPKYVILRIRASNYE